MKATYVQKGEVLDYLNQTGDVIEFNTVLVLGNRIVVAGDNIPVNKTGAVHATGVFNMKKAASEEIAVGTDVYYDASNECITATKDSNVPAGYAVKAAAGTDASISVKIG